MVNISKKVTAGAVSACMIMGTVGLTGCSKNYAKPGNDEDALVLTVGENKVYMDEAKCYIYLTEWDYQYNNEIYAAWLGVEDYWGQAVGEDESYTNKDQAKDDTMESIIEYEILYADAMATGGYDEIPEYEKETIEKNAEALIACMSDDTKKKTGFTKEDFVKVQEKWNIASRYRDAVIEGFNVTEEEVSADYNFADDLRAYETTYIRIPLTTTDTDGNAVEYSDEQKATIKEYMDSIKDAVDMGEDFATVAEEYSEEGAESSSVTFTMGNAKSDDETATDSEETEETEVTYDSPDTEAGAEYMEETINMNGGDISEVFEADGYYYVVKMNDNMSYSVYDEIIETAISESENEQYDAWLKALKEGDYKYTINEEVWNEITFGEVTILPDEFKKAFGTLEDPAQK